MRIKYLSKAIASGCHAILGWKLYRVEYKALTVCSSTRQGCRRTVSGKDRAMQNGCTH